MNKYTFSTQSGKAYYCNSIPGFIKDKSASIIGQLVRHSFEINKEQSDAWENQICELQRRLEECGMEGDIIFEYDIVRLGKRIDIILLIRHAELISLTLESVFEIVFKCKVYENDIVLSRAEYVQLEKILTSGKENENAKNFILKRRKNC